MMTMTQNKTDSAQLDSASASVPDDDEGDPDPSERGLDERALIQSFAEIFTVTAPPSSSPSYEDDCASLRLDQLALTGLPARLTTDPSLLVTTDALCEGVHFDTSWDTFSQIGAQAAVVNLSDLASSGARPIALLWSLSIPLELESESLRSLARGFGEVAGRFGCPVIGGNICARLGSLEIHVTALGVPFSRPISRSGALPGHLVYVTGSLGARALGYLDPTIETRALRHQWRPHLKEAERLALWGQVSAMLDVSDGLLLDAERLAQASGVQIALESGALPRCDAVKRHPRGDHATLSGGEDYVLLFSAPAGAPPPPEVRATCVGRCLERSTAESAHLTLDGEPRAGAGHLYHLKR